MTINASPAGGPATVISARADLLAVTCSALCLLHCVAVPLLVSLIPAVALISEAEWLHRLLVFLAAPVTLWVVIGQQPRPPAGFVVFALVGLGILITAAFAESLEAYETPLTVSGALVLGAAHLWRWRRLIRMGAGQSRRSQPGHRASPS